jgi:hypothetical protein
MAAKDASVSRSLCRSVLGIFLTGLHIFGVDGALGVSLGKIKYPAFRYLGNLRPYC